MVSDLYPEAADVPLNAVRNTGKIWDMCDISYGDVVKVRKGKGLLVQEMSWESHKMEELSAHSTASHNRGSVRQMFSAFSAKRHKEILAAGQKKPLSSTSGMLLKSFEFTFRIELLRISEVWKVLNCM